MQHSKAGMLLESACQYPGPFKGPWNFHDGTAPLWQGCNQLGAHLEERLSEPQAAQQARHICCSPRAGSLSPAMVFAKVWSGQQVYGESDVLQSADISAPRMHHLLDPKHMYHKVLILQQMTHLSSRRAQCMSDGSNVPRVLILAPCAS